MEKDNRPEHQDHDVRQGGGRGGLECRDGYDVQMLMLGVEEKE